MRHSISKVAMKFGFSRNNISLVYSEFRVSGKTSNFRHRCGREKTLKERNQRRLSRILKPDRRATLPQIAADFNCGTSTSVSVQTVQPTIIDMGFRSRRPTCVSLLTVRHKALRLANTAIGLLMTENTLPGLTSRFQLNLADGRVQV